MKILFIEGSDYSGKTTLIKSLKNYLKTNGYKVLTLKEPSSFYREILLKNDNISNSARRKLFEANHLDILDFLYKNKDNYDFAIIDRCAPVSDFIYSSIEETKFNLINTCINDYKLVDFKLYNYFFAENSILIIIKINKETFKNRVQEREIDKEDILDSKDFEFKSKVYDNYSAIIKLLKHNSLRHLSSLFKDVLVFEDGNFKNKIIKKLGV